MNRLIFLVTVFIVIVFANSAITFAETTNYDTNTKFVDIYGVRISSPKEIRCFWNSPSDEYKHCEAVVEFYNASRIMTVSQLPERTSYVFSLPVYNLNATYSTEYTEYNERILNQTCVHELASLDDIENCYYDYARKIFSNWQPRPSSSDVIAVRLIFDSPIKGGKNYAKNSFNITAMGSATVNLDPDISQCAILNESGATYKLSDNVSADNTCFTINNNSITIDCNGYTINYSKTGLGYGVENLLGFNYTTVKNCNIINGGASISAHAVYLNNTNYCNISGNNISTNGVAARSIYIAGNKHANIYNNYLEAKGTTSASCYLGSFEYGFFSNNTVLHMTSSHGLYLYLAHNSQASNNSFYSPMSTYSRGSIYLSSTTNNSFYGNNISTGGTNAWGIYLSDSNYSNFTDNSVYTNGTSSYGIYLYRLSVNNTFSNSTIMSNNTYAIYVRHLSTSSIPANNTIYNCLLNGSIIPVNFSVYFNANFWNTSNQTGSRTYSNGNRIGGNYYTNSTGDGFSDTCDDTDNDGFCDSYYNVSTNSICSGGGCGNNTDYLALSNNYSMPYGFLGVSLSWPIAGDNSNVPQNSTFRINATVNCSSDDPDATCGTVSGTARYNFSSINPDANLNTTDGHKPFFTLSGNPQSCGSMSYGDSCNLSWLVNATGDIGSQWAVDVLFESSEAGVDENQTDDANVTITGCSIDVTLDFIAVLFSNETYQPYPNTYGNEAINNSLSFYNITVNPGSCILDIYTKATDMASDSTGYSIGAANLTFSSTAYDYASSTRYSNAYQMLKSSVNPGTEFINWFWLDIPPILAGTYNGSIYIASVNEGESP